MWKGHKRKYLTWVKTESCRKLRVPKSKEVVSRDFRNRVPEHRVDPGDTRSMESRVICVRKIKSIELYRMRQRKREREFKI